MMTLRIIFGLLVFTLVSVVFAADANIAVNLDSSNLPIFVIDTQGKSIKDEPKTMVRLGVIDNGPDLLNYRNDPFNEYDGWIGLELRGNASLHLFPKKPYTFETRHKDTSNNNVELCGLPRENDWILRAAYIDKTFIRDALAYFMSRSIGRWAPRTRHIELIVDDEYQGIYVLEEQIKPDNDRLDIAKMDSSDIAGEDVTGGYIYEISQDGPGFGERRRFVYPKPDDIMPEQVDYIREYDDQFRRVMRRSDFNDPENGYPKYIDVPAFIDEILVQEAVKNSDTYGWSSYFHKDQGGKLKAGPVWDFDQALSNSTFSCGDCVKEWQIEKQLDGHPDFWYRLWTDSSFKTQLADRWFELRDGPFQTARLFAFVDSCAVHLSEAQERNFQRWPILGEELWRSTDGWQERDTYQKEVDYMRNWLDAHLEWMDDELARFTSVQQTAGPVKLTFQITPNPFHQQVSISYTLYKSQHIRFIVYNVLGQQVKTLVDRVQSKGRHIIRWDGRDARGRHVPPGLYLYRCQLGNKKVFAEKLLKF